MMTVSLSGVTQRYGNTPSLHAIDLEVRPGEFLALVGPSGAGKTTMLRLIAGLETRFTGTLRIGGQDMAGVAARHRNIGFVFQNYALFRHMSVAENVAFGLRVQGRMPRADIRKRVAELLALVQIPHLAERYPGQLSGGQQQRVALARALATEPALMLLDEPFGALDPLVRKDIRAWLRGLHAQLGLTSIFITHDQSEAIELADRVAVMRGGRIVQIGTPAELEATPADPFVFTFLGSSIRIDGTVHGGVFQAHDLPVQPYRVAALDGPAIALLRPHQLRAQPSATGEAIILAARQAGPLVHYTMQTGARRLDIVSTAGPLPVDTRCTLSIAGAAMFPQGATPEEVAQQVVAREAAVV
jgi:sulfate transport system ATP-binding protein